MIQSLLTTIIPMLAASLLMMGGGFRLAKTSASEVTPHRRELLLEFTHAFRSELTRLESLYYDHLESLSKQTSEADRFSLRNSSQNIEGIESIYLFQSPDLFEEFEDTDKDRFSQVQVQVATFPKGPRVSVVASSKELLPDNKSVQISSAIFEEEGIPNPQWISTPSRRYQVQLFRPFSDTLVAFVIDEIVIHRVTVQSLVRGLEGSFQPILSSEDRVLVKSTRAKKALLRSGPNHDGPAAAFIPFRSPLGDFEILAWDGITTKTSYNPTILATTIALVLLLNLIGLFLFVHHRRNTKIAAERVSFVNQVSHELGTPLTNLNLNLDLADEFVIGSPDEAKKRLGLVKDELARLSRLVANVLTFSRKERDNLELEVAPCSPILILQSALDCFRPVLERHQFKITSDLEETPEVLIAPDALAQIVTNLFSNVEKYAIEGRSLAVMMHRKLGKLQVVVSDLGPGIAESQRSKIFAPFERVSQETTEGVSGVGLGLAISRALAIKMGGTLVLQETKKGSSFKLTIPAPLVS